ncbi:hypothetical protein [Thalassobaculum salexigens]|uniref:hypothetical protein n=1 Tax=Thalassobaculum salexigens TaxID=455360 RepID=UPI00042578BC|nr:hypothetical protein [Thalassobaculum salexigens]
MVTLLRTVLLAAAALLFVSLPAAAQQAGSDAGPAAQKVIEQVEQQVDSTFVLTTDQLVAIAGGALVGAIAADLVLHGGAGALLGAVAGGLIGNWLYVPSAPVPGGS